MTNKDIGTLFSEGHCYQLSGEIKLAINCYDELLKSSPNHIETLCFLALAHAQTKDNDSAITYLKRALELKPNDAKINNNLANAYKNIGNFDDAIIHYQKAFELEPNYAQAHNNIAAVYALKGEVNKALHHYHIALNKEPDFITAHFNLGLLFLNKNHLDSALTQFKNVLELDPCHIEAQFYIGVLYLEASNLKDAKLAFNKVLDLNNEHIEAITNLGVIALKSKEDQLAIDYFTKALTIDIDHIEARNNLAATFIHNDRFENSLMHYDVLLKCDPNNIEYLYNVGVAQMSLGHLKEATTHFEAILKLKKDHFESLSNLAAISMRLGEKDKAISLLKAAMKANPQDTSCEFMLSALTGNKSNPNTCTTYVNNLFNNYAINYEDHVKNILEYSLPHKIGALLHKLEITAVKNALDLGCGTGLCGAILRELAEHLTGVDLSAKMLAQAKNKDIYDELVEAEILSFLNETSSDFDLIIAADVLPYFSDLEPLFIAIKNRLHQNGIFIFSHEISDEEPFTLQLSARFSHNPEYIKLLCDKHGFKIAEEDKVVARKQNKEALYEMLYAVIKKQT